jgi:hypothetical protein
MQCAHCGNTRELGDGVEAPRERRRRYGATIKDAMMALWKASKVRQTAQGDDSGSCCRQYAGRAWTVCQPWSYRAGLARRAAAVNCAGNCRPAKREITRGVRDQTAFDRAGLLRALRRNRPSSWSEEPLGDILTGVISRGCGQLGLSDPQSPSCRASQESQLARSIS